MGGFTGDPDPNERVDDFNIYNCVACSGKKHDCEAPTVDDRFTGAAEYGIELCGCTGRD